jgi:hypothetical protein
MTKRMFWFLLGLMAGAATVVVAQKRLQAIKARYAPPAIANRVGDAVKRFGADVAESARTGKATMSERETQLRRGRRRRHSETPVSV